ncbi:hypothetical protein [Microscilla marina]|nr:hypothetical protein [Microscilla marina]
MRNPTKQIFITLMVIYLCSSITCYGQIQIIKRQQPVQVISEYAYWVSSMCEQGCTNIDLGPYKLTKSLKDIPQYKRGVVVWAKGQFVLVKDLPSIAGPRANKSMRGQKVVMRKIDVQNHKEVKFVHIAMSKQAKNKLANQEDFSIDFTFVNPLAKPIQFKLTVGDKTNNVELGADGKKTISVDVPAEKSKSYLNYMVVNENFVFKKYAASLKVAERSGLVIYLNGSVYPKSLAKK